jgi:16S rRNA (adenine1518-N6/adenine1519-N6)-dimethyltransferase
VESALVLLRRVAPPPDRALVRLVHESFAHRRKALAGSLALAPDGEPAIRERARDALVAIGQPADARAERLSPRDFAALEERLT